MRVCESGKAERIGSGDRDEIRRGEGCKVKRERGD